MHLPQLPQDLQVANPGHELLKIVTGSSLAKIKGSSPDTVTDDVVHCMADGTEGRGCNTASGCTEELILKRSLCCLITLVENLLMAANTGESDTVLRMDIT